ATTFARACGYRPSPPGRGARGCAGSRSAGDAAPAAATAHAPRRALADVGSAARSDAASQQGTLSAPRPGNGPADAKPPCAAAPGSEVSPGHLPQHVDV